MIKFLGRRTGIVQTREENMGFFGGIIFAAIIAIVVFIIDIIRKRK